MTSVYSFKINLNEMYGKFPDHTGYVCVYEVEYVQKSWTSTPSITFVSGLLS